MNGCVLLPGFDQLSKELENVKRDIVRSVLSDIDKHRQFIYDSLELTMLSRELPDRLLLYRAVVADPQVEVARKVLAGTNSKTTLSNSNVNRNKKNANTPSASSNQVVGAASESPAGAGLRYVDGETVQDFTGLYDKLLSPPTVVN